MIADSGSRMVFADADTVTAVRSCGAALEEAQATEYPAGSIEGDLMARLVIPRIVVVGGTLQPGERSYDHLRADSARAVPPLQDPEKLAALLYTSGTSGRPRAAMLTHRALLANIEQVAAVEPPMIHGDDVVLGVLPLFHVYGLNAVLGVVMRHRAKLVLTGRFEPQGTLDLIEDEACSVVPVAPPVFAYWRDVDGLRERLGPVRLMLSGSAPLSPELVAEFSELDRHPDPPGLRPHRGLAGGHQHACAARSSSRARSAPRCPASRSGWSTRPAGRPRARTRARSRSGARTCSAATGPTAPTAPTTTAGGPPATSASSTRAATCSWSTGSRSW